LDPGDPYCNSVGSTTSEPYTIKNDVKLVDLLGAVHKLQRTEGTSSAHLLALVLRQVQTSLLS
jgi:hypothetical protein